MRAKGLQSRPLESCFYTGVWRGDVRRPYEFAQMQLTRFRPARRRAGGVRFTRLRRKARHHLFSAISLPKALLPPDSIVLLQLRRKRWHFKNNRRNLWSEVGWLHKSCCFSGHRTPRALPPAMLTHPRQGGARHARLNRVKCTVANT